MTFDELKVSVTRLQQIARDTSRPLKVRTDAAHELTRLKKLAAKSRTPAPRTQDVPPWWAQSHTVLLQSAGVREDQPTIDALVAEFVERGLPVPDYPGKPRDPVPEVERPAAPLPLFDERGMALNAVRTKPRGKRVMTWEDYQDTF